MMRVMQILAVLFCSSSCLAYEQKTGDVYVNYIPYQILTLIPVTKDTVGINSYCSGYIDMHNWEYVKEQIMEDASAHFDEKKVRTMIEHPDGSIFYIDSSGVVDSSRGTIGRIKETAVLSIIWERLLKQDFPHQFCQSAPSD